MALLFLWMVFPTGPNTFKASQSLEKPNGVLSSDPLVRNLTEETNPTFGRVDKSTQPKEDEASGPMALALAAKAFPMREYVFPEN